MTATTPSAFADARRRLLWLSAASFAVLASPALAQDATQVGTLKVGGESAGEFTTQPPKDNGYRATRAVTATKTETELRDTPQAVTVVTRQQIDDRAVQSMADAVRYAPGVTFAQGEGNRDAPVIRGVSTTGDFFVDGLRDDVQYFRDVYNLERVEILNGPNAMIFGRGGSGGVINRVTRQADWNTTREVRVEAGSDAHYRGAFDLGQGVNDAFALRLTGVYQDSESYRDDVELKRWGLNPTASVKLGDDTLVTLGYEHFEDERTADRGVPSFNGRPVDTDPSTFFGDPAQSVSDATVDAFSATVEHRFANGVTLRNKTRYADYEKFYQNVYATGLINGGADVTLGAYNDRTDRTNLFSQTDVTAYLDLGGLRHTLLVGTEFGRQETDNMRMLGTFTAGNTAPVTDPNVSIPVTFGPSPSVNNSSVVTVAAAYLQDQIAFSDKVQVVLGLRYDHVEVDFDNNNTGADIATEDGFWSPRVGLIYRPIDPVSLYASYSKTFVPRAGDQLTSLTPSAAAFDPEEFENVEVGVKWDVRPELTLTAALYHLNRSNVVVATGPLTSELVDGQRTRGVELGASGRITDRWSVVASYAYQDGEFTGAPPAGNKLANLPEHSFALWNRYQVMDALGLGLGVIHQSSRFAAADNAVELPSFTRVDAAAFYDVNERLSVQVNVENLLDEEYFANAHNNHNITPGSPRAVKVGLTARF